MTTVRLSHLTHEITMEKFGKVLDKIFYFLITCIRRTKATSCHARVHFLSESPHPLSDFLTVALLHSCPSRRKVQQLVAVRQSYSDSGAPPPQKVRQLDIKLPLVFVGPVR